MVNRSDKCDLQRATACFAEWMATVCTQETASDVRTIQEAEVVVVGGRGVVQGVVVPEDTPPGTYVLEVFDAVNEMCLLPVETEVHDSNNKPPLPKTISAIDRMEELCRLVPSAGSSKSTHKIYVE